MHINNKAGWIETFTVAESVLCVKTGLTDRTLRKVRNELKQKGRIDFFSRKGGKAPIYKLISFFSTEFISADSSGENKRTEINSAGSAGDSAGGSAGDSSALYKLNKTKLNKTNNIAAATPVNFFDEYLLAFNRQPSPIQVQEINSFIDQDGLTDEVICLAFRKASENGAGYPYARSIINSWAKKGVKTLEDVNREQSEFEAKRAQGKQRRGSATRKELLPDWFDEEQQKQTTVPGDMDARKKEIEEKLKLFRAN